jgi:V/A-type H+/Na+-transporting ATPase subunit E
MPEDLQALIDRLQRDAVEEGQRRAQRLLQEAEAAAAAIVRDAHAAASAEVARAAREADAYAARSRVALEGAGRDLLITVRHALDRLLDDVVHEAVGEQLKPELLGDLIIRMTDAYASRDGRARKATVLLSAADLESLVRLFAQRYRDRLRDGVELRLGDAGEKGFRLVLVGDHLEHDFTQEAIAEALKRHLRPHLARIVPGEASSTVAATAGDAR